MGEGTKGPPPTVQKGEGAIAVPGLSELKRGAPPTGAGVPTAHRRTRHRCGERGVNGPDEAEPTIRQSCGRAHGRHGWTYAAVQVDGRAARRFHPGGDLGRGDADTVRTRRLLLLLRLLRVLHGRHHARVAL